MNASLTAHRYVSCALAYVDGLLTPEERDTDMARRVQAAIDWPSESGEREQYHRQPLEDAVTDSGGEGRERRSQTVHRARN